MATASSDTRTLVESPRPKIRLDKMAFALSAVTFPTMNSTIRRGRRCVEKREGVAIFSDKDRAQGPS